MIDLRDPLTDRWREDERTVIGGEELQEYIAQYDTVGAEASCEGFSFGVDQAVELRNDELLFPATASVTLWQSGTLVDIFHAGRASLVHHGDVELVAKYRGGKLHISFVGGPISIIRGTQGIAIEFQACSKVYLGINSSQPTPPWIRSPLSVDGIADAISHFGGVFDRFAPDRAFVGNRPIPPTVCLSDEMETSACLSRPQFPIRIEVPRSIPDIFMVAPLAYYLGASVDPVENADHMIDLDGRQVGLGFSASGDQRVPAETLFEAVELCCEHLRALDSLTWTSEAFVQSDTEQEVLAQLHQQGFAVDPADFADLSHFERVCRFFDFPVGILDSILPNREGIDLSTSPVDIVSVPTVCQELRPIRSPPQAPKTEAAPAVQEMVQEFFYY